VEVGNLWKACAKGEGKTLINVDFPVFYDNLNFGSWGIWSFRIVVQELNCPFYFEFFCFKYCTKRKKPRQMEIVVNYGLSENRVVGTHLFWFTEYVEGILCPELQCEWAIVPGVPQVLKNLVQPELCTFYPGATVRGWWWAGSSSEPSGRKLWQPNTHKVAPAPACRTVYVRADPELSVAFWTDLQKTRPWSD
jgi:hypothetical protein